MSMFNDYFMMKYDFYQETIPKYSRVKFITIINNSCLVENINTKKREWVMKCEIYPLCNKIKLDKKCEWSYSENFHNIAKEHNYL